MYEVFEHTADVGLRIAAPDLSSLLADAGSGLFAIIAGDLGQIRETDAVPVSITGSDPAYLLFDWLNELLWLFESKRLLFRRFDVLTDAGSATGTAHGERFDPARHRLLHEVKAVTYHQLSVARTARGLEGTVILDI